MAADHELPPLVSSFNLLGIVSVITPCRICLYIWLDVLSESRLKSKDSDARGEPGEELWREEARVDSPGPHLMV